MPPHLQAMGNPRVILFRMVAVAVVVVGSVVGLFLYSGSQEDITLGPVESPPAEDMGGAVDPLEPASMWIDGVGAAGATVFIDSDSVGMTPLWLDRVGVGQRSVQVVGPDGALLVDTMIVVVAGQTSEVAVDPLAFPRDPLATAAGSASSETAGAPTGDLRVTSSPAGAAISLNGRRVGTTPMSLGGLRPGRHSLTLSFKGYEATARQVDVRPERMMEVAVALRPLASAAPSAAPSPSPNAAPAPPTAAAPAATGTLEILVRPWGRIVIDGTTHKRETDVVYRAELTAGPHQVSAWHPQLGSVERTVVVRPGAQSRVEFDLAEGTSTDGR